MGMGLKRKVYHITMEKGVAFSGSTEGQGLDLIC